MAAIVVRGGVANADEGSPGGRFRRVTASPLQILRRSDVRTELEFRYCLQRGAMVRALASAGIKLSDAEMDRLTAVRQEVEAGVRKKIAVIQQQAQMEILGSVMSGEKIRRLLGDDFVFQRSPYPR